MVGHLACREELAIETDQRALVLKQLIEPYNIGKYGTIKIIK